MKKVNLRGVYPDVYKNDHFVEVTEDVLETIQSAERAEAAGQQAVRVPGDGKGCPAAPSRLTLRVCRVENRESGDGLPR